MLPGFSKGDRFLGETNGGSRRLYVGLLMTHVIAALGCAVDLWSKWAVFGWLGLPSGRVHWIWEPFVGFETSINTGALAGIGQGNVVLLAGISVIAIFVIELWLWRGEGALDRWLAIAMGFVLAGILGNLYDRLGLWGIHGVRDWILFRYQRFVWPNFNLADTFLVCGAAMIVIQSVFRPSSATSAAESTKGITA